MLYKKATRSGLEGGHLKKDPLPPWCTAECPGGRAHGGITRQALCTCHQSIIAHWEQQLEEQLLRLQRRHDWLAACNMSCFSTHTHLHPTHPLTNSGSHTSRMHNGVYWVDSCHAWLLLFLLLGCGCYCSMSVANYFWCHGHGLAASLKDAIASLLCGHPSSPLLHTRYPSKMDAKLQSYLHLMMQTSTHIFEIALQYQSNLSTVTSSLLTLIDASFPLPFFLFLSLQVRSNSPAKSVSNFRNHFYYCPLIDQVSPRTCLKVDSPLQWSLRKLKVI